MKKIVLALIMVLSSSLAYAVMPPEPHSLPNGGYREDANVTVDVVKPLKIFPECNPCNDRKLPDITIGTTITGIARNIAFRIEGMPTIDPVNDPYPIIVTHDGYDPEADGSCLYYGDGNPGVIMKGRWGSFDNGTVNGRTLPCTFGMENFPLILSPTGKAYCNFIVDELTAAIDATIEDTEFYLNVYAEYRAM